MPEHLVSLETAETPRAAPERSRVRRSHHWVTWAAVLLAIVVAIPVLGLLATVFDPNVASRDVLAHLLQTVLPSYVGTTLILLVTVGIGTAVVGITVAWIVAAYDFPGKRLYEWALILPLAVPTYVMAYAFTDFLQFSGPVQSVLRELTGQRRLPWFPDVRSVGWAVMVFIFALYPYVYLLVRTAFLERSPRLHDAARTLGCTPLQAFLRVVLPLARPAAVAGVALVLMETLADYGAVAYFGVQTFTTGIYRAWLSMSDRVAAAQLASALLLFVFILLMLEKRSRGRLRFYGVGQRFRRPESRRLKGRRAWFATAICALPLLIGFVLPTTIMVRLAVRDVDTLNVERYLLWFTNTLKLASITAALAVLCTLLLAYAVRLAPGRLTRMGNDIASLGYAVPGAVLAVGILIPLTRLDHWLSAHGWLTGVALTGTMAALLYAYLVRFLSAGLQTIEAGLTKITPAVDASARSLGASNWELLTRVHAPLLRRSVLTAALLVFVDVMKELPATLVLRPFNMDTLAVITNQLASDERLGEAAVPALTIVLAGLVPVILLARAISRKN